MILGVTLITNRFNKLLLHNKQTKITWRSTICGLNWLLFCKKKKEKKLDLKFPSMSLSHQHNSHCGSDPGLQSPPVLRTPVEASLKDVRLTAESRLLEHNPAVCAEKTNTPKKNDQKRRMQMKRLRRSATASCQFLVASQGDNCRSHVVRSTYSSTLMIHGASNQRVSHSNTFLVLRKKLSLCILSIVLEALAVRTSSPVGVKPGLRL